VAVPLDPAQDPDRFRADADGPVDPARDPDGPLDPAFDPDRYDPQRDGQQRDGQSSSLGRTLPELLGDGAYEDPRKPYAWLTGLVGIVAFLLLVAFLIGRVGPA
jgi:hypothetical protein